MSNRKYYRTLSIHAKTHALLKKWKSMQMGGGSIAKFITAAVLEKLWRDECIQIIPKKSDGNKGFFVKFNT